ncbi:DUF6011 domain-containing protein [Acetatifactor aquisgranensis]|uniref:DUF6011 domain-containing protein n=1 Tax=Acetatifactor aquisgranensis TaxID=2941233 RepID=UPI00203F288E|nr:DUF6011 domain-containing protein [Acetatifactor aquisgranensis]
MMRCSICGRRLKDARSRELGYGPVCYKRKFGTNMHASRKAVEAPVEEKDDQDLPGQMSMDDYLQVLSRQ